MKYSTVLALATLGDAAQIGLFLFVSCHPRWPRQVQYFTSCVTTYRVFAVAYFGKYICQNICETTGDRDTLSRTLQLPWRHWAPMTPIGLFLFV
jgi:hypothetical protein